MNHKPTFYLFSVSGTDEEKQQFFRRYLEDGNWSFNKFIPMPPAVDIEVNNYVQDGYAALHGDWQEIAHHRMFKVHAETFQMEFPLTSREDLIKCIEALGLDGQKRLALGQRYHENLRNFSYGDTLSWRKGNWGIACDAEDLVVQPCPDLKFSFMLYAAMPPKLLKDISKANPQLAFEVQSAAYTGHHGKAVKLQNGRMVKIPECTPINTLPGILLFRQAFVLSWLKQTTSLGAAAEYLDVADDGSLRFKGMEMTVKFLLHRIRRGLRVEQAFEDYPELREGHRRALRGLLKLA